MVQQTRPWQKERWALVALLFGLFLSILWTGSAVKADDEAKATALIDQMPANGLVGVWQIGGINYQVAPGARLRQEEGPFVVGACVEVEYAPGAPHIVHKMQTKHQHDCADDPDATPTMVPTAPPVGTPGTEFEVYGRVESLPAGLIGEWVVDGVTFVADSSTEFQHEHGGFAVGRCVKLHASSTTTPATILEIENERGFHCTANHHGDEGDDDGDNDGEHHAHGVIFGRLQSFPETLVGDWNVGGMTFVAISTTQFIQHSGVFTVGAMIKVQFMVDANGANQARRIETKSSNNHHGHHDDGDGNFEGDQGHAFGTIDELPADGLIGLWIIGGNPYSVTAETGIMEPPTNFVIGAKVRVKYFTDANGDRIVSKLQTTTEDSGADDASHSTLFATVDEIPASGFVGDWILDNMTFVATDTTKFEEEQGVLGVGAYVKVEYFVQDGIKIIHELEVHVPPGAGDDLRFGEIESTGDGVAAAAIRGTVWKVAGTSYTVTPATDLDDLQSAITVGSTAVVNSYTAADGSQVATQIRGVTMNNRLYLSIIQR